MSSQYPADDQKKRGMRQAIRIGVDRVKDIMKRPSSPRASSGQPGGLTTPNSGSRILSFSRFTIPSQTPRGKAWSRLGNSLHVLERSVDSFPPLRSAIGSLIDCLDVVKKAASNRADCEELAQEFQSMADVLQEYVEELDSEPSNGSIANITECIRCQVEEIKQKGGTTGHLLDATRNEEDVIRSYRRVERLFRQLQCDLSMRTRKDIRALLEGTLLQRMSPVDDARYNSGYSTTIRRRACTAETRKAIHQTLQDWSTNPKSEKIYWMNGMAGTGKTTIAYSFCEWLEKTNRLGASFFCSRISATCRSLSQIIPTIAYRLAQFSPAFRSKLCAALNDDPDAGKLNVVQQFEKLVNEPMLKAKDAIPDGVVIVIDALDECDDNYSVRLLLDLLLKFAEQLPLKFFVSSRPEAVIRERMMSQGGAARSIVYLHDIEESIVVEDIKKYLTEALGDMTPPPSPTQIDLLAKRSRNLFIYAATVVRYIYPQVFHVDSGARLEAMLVAISDRKAIAENKYDDLDRLYTTVLRAPMMQQAQTWLRNTESSQDEIQKQVSDARNFVIWFAANPCSRSTPHIYISALPSCAKSSWVYKQYIKRTRGLASIITTEHDEAVLAIWSVESAVCSMSISPEGDCIVTGSGDGNVHVYDTHTGAVIAGPFKGHTDAVHAVAFSCGGTHIASGSNDKTIIVWDALTGRMATGPLNKHNTFVMSVAFSPDGKQLASGSADKSIIVWDSSTGAMLLGPLGGHTDMVFSVSFSPDGRLVASGSYDRCIRFWDAHTGAALATLKGHGSTVTEVAFSPDGTRLVSCSSDGIRLWNVEERTLVGEPFTGHEGSIQSIAFSSDNAHIVSGGGINSAKSVIVWEAATGLVVSGPLSGHSDVVKSVIFSPDNSRILSCSTDKTIRIWDIQPQGRTIGQPNSLEVAVGLIGFLPNNTQMVSSSSRGVLRVWDMHTGKIIPREFEGQEGLETTAFSFHGTLVASTTGSDLAVQLWDAATGKAISQPLTGHSGMVKCLDFSPDGVYLCSGSEDGTIIVWDIEASAMVGQPYKGHTGAVNSVKYSPDGTCIASGGADRTVMIWDVSTGKRMHALKEHENSVSSVTFWLDGSYIVSGSVDGVIRKWEVENGHCARTFYGPNLYSYSYPGQSTFANCICLSPNGTRIVSGFGSSLRLFDSQYMTLISELGLPRNEVVHWVGYSPSGTDIISVSTTAAPKATPEETSEETTQKLSQSPNIVRVWRANVGSDQPGSPLTHHGWSYKPDGRVLSPAGLVVWVPPDLLPLLTVKSESYFNPLVITAGGVIDLGYQDACVGNRWTECYITEDSVSY
ncbi:unnamed protein product [Rhizoctonia solani]|uniref:Nephrocystin 3-like N-terminal domain-containing protein n=1 Tax=Rhizoctonia solani TaxID=456999 RepID=A0A8H3HKE1_9AGAM|nr:unnamed protein product [Rhizoctonia solani]